MFLAIALLYYFALEASIGQTLGKRALGLRVSRTGGVRPSVWAVAGRTLLRIIDWLPAMYLVGFITMMATGTRRQRIGDLAAGTAVTRALPVRHRGLTLAPLALVLLAALGLSVYRVTSAGSAQTYRAHGVSFDYPAGWQEESIPARISGGAQLLWTVVVTPGTLQDFIRVEEYRVHPSVSAPGIDAIAPGLKNLVNNVFGQLGGGVQAGPEKITMAGIPAVRFRATGTANGSRTRATVVFAFDGTSEYFVDCEHTSANTAEVERACNRVVGSFQVARSPARSPGRRHSRD